MQVVSLEWYPAERGEDIHLMQGRATTINLTTWLRVITNSGKPSLANFLTQNAATNAQCTFKPTFKNSLNSATGDYEGFGVRVNSKTGLVSIPGNSVAPGLHNFTVIATLVADPSAPVTLPIRAYLRIHVHNYIAKAWLSPSSLSVPKNAGGGFQFTIMAQFDDKTIGRLPGTSQQDSIAQDEAGNDIHVIEWSSVPPDKLDKQSGYISLATSDPDGTPIKVSAKLSPDYKDANGGDVTATGAIIPYSPPQVAQLIPNSAGYEQRNEVPNFLILADGFQAADQPRFNAMIDLFMRDLRQNDKFKPFDQLVGRMNFWKLFVPSATRGIGSMFEVFGGGHAQPITEIEDGFVLENDAPASVDDLHAHSWGPNQICLYFGLPVPAHQNMSNNDIKAYWKQISYLLGTLIDAVPDGMIDTWKKQGDRRLVDESDTFLGSVYGTPTRAKALPFENRDPLEAFYGGNVRRFARNRINDYLVTLQYQDPDGTLKPLGAVWDMFASGKDSANVIVLLCANSGRARNEGVDLFVNTISDERSYIGIEADTAVNAGFADGRAVKMAALDAERIPADLPLMPGKTTLLHEISHSLGLGDEYGELGIGLGDRHLVFTGTGDIDSDRRNSNTQYKSDLVDTPGSDDIDVAKIKWRWHRIAKSAVLAQAAPPAPAAITASGTQYTIKLQPGQAVPFAAGDVVILRHRELGQSLLRDIEYSQVETPRYPFVTRSPELVIRQVNAASDQVVVEAVNAGDLTGHDLTVDFPAECVVYVPQPARYDYPPTGENLELISANILEFMAGTRRPVHENLDSNGQPLPDNDAEQSPDLSDPNLAAITGIAGCAKKNRDIVALYAGGNSYHHGIYHATGHCIMRNNREIAEFCSACKYILTDFIDPSLHPEVDKQFDRYYPLKPK